MGHRKRGEGTAGCSKTTASCKWAVKHVHENSCIWCSWCLGGWQQVNLGLCHKVGWSQTGRKRPHGSLSLEWKSGQRKEVFFPVIWEQLRNSGQESCTFPSPGLLRLCQLQPVEDLTLESMWASLTEAFSSPGGSAEQHKGRGTALQSAEAAVGPSPPQAP